MQTINEFYLNHFREQIKESAWCRSAPAEAKKSLEVKLLGVRTIKTASLMTRGQYPAVIAEATMSADGVAESQKFVVVLNEVCSMLSCQNADQLTEDH